MRSAWLLATLAAGLCCLPAIVVAEQPTFRSYELATPGGKRIGVVDMTISGKRSRIVEVVSAMPGWPVGKRAEAVASRLRQVCEADPSWWKRLSVGKAKQSVVVAVAGMKDIDAPKASDGSVYVITADPKFAREWGQSPQGLARQLVSDIKQAFEPKKVSWGRRGSDGQLVPPPPLTAEQKLANAIRMKQDGDDAFSKDDPISAEANYKDAIKMSPEYAVPYLRLAELYCSQGQLEQAKAVLQQAKRLKSLTADDKSEISRLMAKVK